MRVVGFRVEPYSIKHAYDAAQPFSTAPTAFTSTPFATHTLSAYGTPGLLLVFCFRLPISIRRRSIFAHKPMDPGQMG